MNIEKKKIGLKRPTPISTSDDYVEQPHPYILRLSPDGRVVQCAPRLFTAAAIVGFLPRDLIFIRMLPQAAKHNLFPLRLLLLL